jgi:hypothetical protein
MFLPSPSWILVLFRPRGEITIAQDVLVYANHRTDPRLSDRRRCIAGGKKLMFSE